MKISWGKKVYVYIVRPTSSLLQESHMHILHIPDPVACEIKLNVVLLKCVGPGEFWERVLQQKGWE